MSTFTSVVVAWRQNRLALECTPAADIVSCIVSANREEDLLWHLENGYRLESAPVGTGPLLRKLKDNSVIRTASANQSTVKALEEHGLIKATQSRDKLTTVWRATRRTP